MKRSDCGKWLLLGMVLVMAGLMVGCRLAVWSGAVAVATVGVVGYTVYQGGESVVTGVGDMAGGGGADKSKGGETVVFSGKVLKTECDGTVAEVWQAATSAFRRANFQDLAGNYDLLSGELTAQTWDKMPVTLKLKSAAQNRTTLWIWVGPEGDLKAAESVHNLIREELKIIVAARPPAAQKEVAP
jgi:hypothetical protein